ncbi:hypothetical protein [Shimia sp. MIT1388]|uniref:hypothetical protein n=1 Tax=Shimia sp. MIT1388 TaxID=3096992 RepID=UPI00399B1EF2
MKDIQVSTDVFAMIWSMRKPPETNENEILLRVLKMAQAQKYDSNGDVQMAEQKEGKTSNPSLTNLQGPKSFGKVRWVDDVQEALLRLGGKAALASIYAEVEKLRKQGNRSVPASLEATIRRTIEDHSSDSENFRGVDLFEQISRGVWGLRSRS